MVNGDSYSIPTKTVNIPTRPSMDSLLDELDTSLSSKRYLIYLFNLFELIYKQ